MEAGILAALCTGLRTGLRAGLWTGLWAALWVGPHPPSRSLTYLVKIVNIIYYIFYK